MLAFSYELLSGMSKNPLYSATAVQHSKAFTQIYVYTMCNVEMTHSVFYISQSQNSEYIVSFMAR